MHAALEAAAGKVTQEQVSAAGDAYKTSFLHICLGAYNGGMQYLDTYVGMPFEEIVATAKTIGKANLIPFAKDIDGGL